VEYSTEAGIPRRLTVGRRDGTFESPEAITAMERRLASPS
jgi:hypothetical protein